jgi:hypothetical protein
VSDADLQACDMNLGPRQRARRGRLGVIGLVAFVGFAAWLISTGGSRGLRLAAFVPAFVAAIGLVQYQAKTCVRLAAAGTANLDGGDERISDDRIRGALRARGLRLTALAVGLAAAATGLLVVAA